MGQQGALLTDSWPSLAITGIKTIMLLRLSPAAISDELEELTSRIVDDVKTLSLGVIEYLCGCILGRYPVLKTRVTDVVS